MLEELLATTHLDFGKDILPIALKTYRVAAYLFRDYWEDIGTIKAFFDANLMLCEDEPPFRFYVPEAPIFTRARFLPPTVFRDARIERSLVADGCVLQGARVVHSVIGQRAWLLPGSRVEDTIIMGADFYEVGETRAKVIRNGRSRSASVRARRSAGRSSTRTPGSARVPSSTATPTGPTRPTTSGSCATGS